MRRFFLVPSVICSLVVLAWPAWGQGELPRRLEQDLPPYGTLRWDRGSQPVLLILPLPGDGWLTLARRFSGTTATARRLWDANPRLKAPQRGRAVRMPLELLRADLRFEALHALFASDQRVVDGWRHRVLDPFGGGEESWQLLAELYTGQGEHAAALRRANPDQPTAAPRRKGIVLIPQRLLLPVFRDITPITPTPTPTPATAAAPGPVATPLPGRDAAAETSGVLTYGRDAAGEYAVYRLRRGEALYSAVVVRFTGQLTAVQVNETAAFIAERSGIDDVTDIPVGYPIRIPLDLLLPEYLPAGDPRRQQWQQEQQELASYVEEIRAADLSGVHVILDAGHGGQDTGALVDGVWEATYTYDLMCRIKSLLERHTRATVWITSKDLSRQYLIPDKDRLRQDRDQVLLTLPTFDLSSYTAEQRHLPIHLRWYLGNDIVNRLAKQGVPPAKVVFLSIHANSLHSSVQGAMVYVPSRHMRPSSYTVKDRAMRRYQEYRNNPTVELASGFKAKSEASSRHLAKHVLEAVGNSDLAVHLYSPIRDRVRQGKRSYVPAVLRFSLAQHSVLVECCNMGNAEDRKNLQDRAWREQFARAIVTGLAASFGT